MDIKKLFNSFKYAVSGIVHTLKNEQNLKIHMIVASLIIPFAYFYEITRQEWAVLIVSIGFVIFAELINTALEEALDAYSKEKNINIKHAKDIAAGAVLFAAISSVGVGIALFGDIQRIAKTLAYIFTDFIHLFIFLIILAVDIIFLILTRQSIDKERK